MTGVSVKVILGNATWLSHCRSIKIVTVESELWEERHILKNASEREGKKVYSE
jgi:hypothetical protein